MLRKIIIAVAVVIVLAVAVVFLSLNSVVRKGVETFLPTMTGTNVSLDEVKLSPFSGKGTIRGLIIGNPEGFNTTEAFRLTEVKIHLSPASILSGQPVIHEIIVDGAEVTYEFKGLTSSNISQIMDNVQQFAGDEKEKPAGEKKKVKIERFVFSNAKIHLSATVLEGKKISATMPDIELNDIGDKSLAESVTEITTALWDGLKDAGNELKAGITDLGGGLTEGIKGLFSN